MEERERERERGLCGGEKVDHGTPDDEADDARQAVGWTSMDISLLNMYVLIYMYVYVLVRVNWM